MTEPYRPPVGPAAEPADVMPLNRHHAESEPRDGSVSAWPRDRLERWLLMLGALLLLAAGIGLRGPTPSDEPRFALVAHQMVASGNWLIPHRGSDWYSDKPPLFMAMQAWSYTLTGNWSIAFLLPSLLSSLGTLWLVYDLGRRLWGHRAGVMGSLALLCTVQFVFQAKRGQIDPTVTFFITLANAGLLRHLLLGPDWRAFWLGCFAAGLGVITKGVGFLPLMMLLPWALAVRRRWLQIPAATGCWVHWIGGLLAFALAIALWMVPLLFYVHLHHSSEARAYLHDIFFNQTVNRYVHPWNSFQPPWFYLIVIFTSWLPLSLALPGLVPAWRERLRAHDARILLPVAWIVMVIVFFSLTRAKRDVYIMPALPMLALCAGPYLEDALRQRGLSFVAKGFLLLLGGMALGIGVAALAFHPDVAERFAAARQLGKQTSLWWSLCIALGAWLLLQVAIFRRRHAGTAVLAGMAGVWVIWGVGMAPLLARASSPAALANRVEQTIGPHAELALVAWKEELPLAFARPLVDFGFVTPWHQQLASAIRWQTQAPSQRWVLVLADVMGPCIIPSATVDAGVTSGRDWRLFRSNAVAPSCRDGQVPAGALEDWGGIDSHR